MITEEIINMYKSGESTRTIANMVGKSQSFISKIVRNAGVARNLSDARKVASSQGRVDYSIVSENLPTIPWNKGKIGVQQNVNKGLKKPEWSGINHWNWQGGITRESHAARTCLEFKQWTRLVRERDDYTCQSCGKVDPYNHAHHIMPFALYEKLRYEVRNGITLCVECHIAVHKILKAIYTCETSDELLGQLDESLAATAQSEKIIAIAMKTANGELISSQAPECSNSMGKVQRLDDEVEQPINHPRASDT